MTEPQITSYEVTGEIDSAAELMIHGVQDANDFVFKRSGAGTSAEITYYAVLFDNGTPSEAAKRLPAVSIRGGTAAYSTASNPGNATFNLDSSAGNELRFDRGATGTSGAVS